MSIFNNENYCNNAQIYILQSDTKKLIIIDYYVDNTILDIVKRLNIQVIIITKEACNLLISKVNKTI